ncbi:uncharacterized protein LOC144902203 isoform X1 [Branchiostoma floridae x Branchiostoma belcheri]
MASGKFRLRCVFLVVLLALLLTGGDGWRRRRRRRCSCPWGGWGAWSGCSSACGGGTQHRSRFRNACCSPSQETQTSTCNTHSCCSCTWRPWSYWSSCSRTCDGGTQHRARSRNSCCGYPNQQTQTNTCNTHSCCSCTWRPWGHWSSCSRTCGGANVGCAFAARTQALWIRKSTPVMNREPDEGGTNSATFGIVMFSPLKRHLRTLAAYSGEELQSKALRKVSDRHRNVSKASRPAPGPGTTAAVQVMRRTPGTVTTSGVMITLMVFRVP